MTPPRPAGATEAVNQEMETIPSQAPSDVLSFTLSICVKWTSTGYRVPRTATPKTHYKFLNGQNSKAE